MIHRQVNFTSTKIHKDSAGRFILVNGLIDGVEVCLMNIYAPNEDERSFIRTIFFIILHHSSGIVLLGGDFNCVMSQHLDRQPLSSTTSMMSNTLRDLSTESGLVDIWRNKHPKGMTLPFFA